MNLDVYVAVLFCEKFLETTKKNITRKDVNQLYEDYSKVFIIGDIICCKCRLKFRKEKALANALKESHENESSSSKQTEDLEDSQTEHLSSANVEESPLQQDISDVESVIESS